MLDMYPACFFKEENGYSVIFPDLNWLATCGDTLQDAMEMAVDCLAGYLHTCRLDGDDIGQPSAIESIDILKIAKEIDPDDEAVDGFVSMVTVDVEAYAREHFDKSVKKTLSIPAWLNKAALEQGINFSQTLQEALKEKLKIS